MKQLNSFLLGVGVAFGIYYITRKRDDGSTLLDEILENPKGTLNKIKEEAVSEVVQTVKSELM